MKILTVSQFYTPDITAAAFRISETVGYLEEFGNEVEVITTYPHKGSADGHEVEEKENIHRVRLPDTENRGFLGYIYCYVSFMVKSIIQGYRVGRKFKPGIIWASSPPIFVGIAGWVLARLLGAQYALDIRDIWPDSAVAAGQLSQDGSAYAIGRWMERFMYTHADIITCVANPMRDYISTHTRTEIAVIYNGVETSYTKKNTASDQKVTLKPSNPDSKQLLYAGNFGHVQQLDLLITAFSDFESAYTNHDWEVFFLGDGAQRDSLVRLVNTYELSGKIHFLDPVPKSEVFCYLEASDALFIHLMDSEVLRLTIPSKVFDYMLVNRPLLAGIHGEGKQIIENSFGNVTFDPGDRPGLLSAMKELDQKLIEYQKRNENGRVVQELYSRYQQSKKLHSIFNEKLA